MNEETQAGDRELLEIHSTSTYFVTGLGQAFSADNPVETRDFSELIGHRVILDGRPARVKAVERFAHGPPWRKGEPIGLLVDFEPHT